MFALAVALIILAIVATYLRAEWPILKSSWSREWRDFQKNEQEIQGTPTPKPAHAWKAPPPLPPGKTDRLLIEFALCGQVCDCGAARLYNGPALGFTVIREGDGSHV